MKPNPSPERPSMVRHAMEIIRQRLAEGRWGQKMPGERELAVQLGVSRSTLRKALQELERKGLIERQHGKPSKPTRKAIKHSKASLKGQTVIVLTPDALQRLPTRAIYVLDELRSTLADTGHRLEIRAFPHRGNDVRELANNLISMEPDAIWLLYQQPKEVHRSFHASGNPCVVFGTQDADYPLPAVDMDQKAVCRHAAMHLLRRGYKANQIVLVYGSLGLPGNILMTAGLREACGDDAKVAEIPLDPDVAPAALDKLVTGLPKPVALILAHTRHAACALSHFSAVKRYRIPEDVGLVCLNDDPLYNFIKPDISRYESDTKRTARSLASLVMRAATGARVAPKMVHLFPEFLPGNSILSPFSQENQS